MLPTLQTMDYAVLQQCMHCGMCLPTCPTYDATKRERNSPRGRIALMRAIADRELAVSPAFAAWWPTGNEQEFLPVETTNALAEPIIVENTLWTSANPQAYAGGVQIDAILITTELDTAP